MLSAHQVLHGYTQGVFPMAEPDEDNAIYWYEPEMRGVIFLDEFICSKNLKKLYNNKVFDLRINSDFEGTMRACATRDETWISEEIIETYCGLNSMGYGFSFETWQDNKLVGGLYGVAMGQMFFGESMFHHISNASKVALVFLVEWMKANNFKLLDCQFITDHLKQFGAREIPQAEYLEYLDKYR